MIWKIKFELFKTDIKTLNKYLNSTNLKAILLCNCLKCTMFFCSFFFYIPLCFRPCALVCAICLFLNKINKYINKQDSTVYSRSSLHTFGEKSSYIIIYLKILHLDNVHRFKLR